MSLRKIFLFGLFIRLIIALFSSHLTNFDVESYLKVGRITLNKENIYPQIARIHHPYLPFFLYIEAAAIYLSNFQINPILFIKIINIIFDLGNIYLVYLLSKKDLRSALIYGINPVTILISAFHGQFDTIPLFFLLFAIYFFKKNKIIFSFLIYSLAITIKTWPILFIIPFIKRLKKISLLFLILLFPLLSIFIYYLQFKVNPFDIFFTVVKYQSLFGFFGLGRLILLTSNIISLSLPIFFQRFIFLFSFLIFVVLSIFIKEKRVEKEFLFTIIIFYIISTNFAIQYLSWCIPFLILVKPKLWKFLILIMSIFLFINYFAWILSINLESFSTIFGILLWIYFLVCYVISIKKY